MSASPRLIKRFSADGRRSGRVFYGWMRRSRWRPQRALNVGAGPGHSNGAATFAIRDLRSPGQTVVGYDTDPMVLASVQADSAVVKANPDVEAFADESFGLA